MCLTETGLVASSCNEKGRYVGCALFGDRGLGDSTGVNGQHGSVSGISHDRKEGGRKGKTTQQEGARLEDLYSGGHVRCTGMCESRA